jgi:tetratricopeptide (TPR) repeat protein
VARHGARTVRSEEGSTTASDAWRQAMARADGQRAKWEPDEVWVEDPDPEEVPPIPSSTRLAEAPSHRFNVPRPVVDELSKTAGAQRGGKLAERLAGASHAYDRERYQEAKRMLRPLAEEVPDAAAVRELLGLTLYRMGQWVPAAKELELYRQLSGSVDQHPVLADCYRALHRYRPAAELWEELRLASPSAEAVAEGRIVAAGCLADQGDLKGAIALLERASRRLRNPEDHHLRQWYVLGDLYERAGDLPRARDLFGRVVSADPAAYDARRRLAGLR